MDTMHVTDQNRSTRGETTSWVAQAVRQHAHGRLLSQADLALVLGCSRMTASRKWRGVTPWTVAELQRIAPLLGCESVAQLLTRPAA